MTKFKTISQKNQEPFSFVDLKLQVRKWGAEIIEKHHGRSASLKYLWESEQLSPILGADWQMTNYKSKFPKKYSFLPKPSVDETS